jgi:L-threonylcarbamoyladenylate synthase
MRVLTKDEVNVEKAALKESILDGAVFIYPTDTIYGIGCNALKPESVKKIREIKKRTQNPFSVIAPSKQWIFDNCQVSEEAMRWVEKLPGPYTLILKTNNNSVAKEVNQKLNTLGIRIPQHWFSSFVSELEVPIVTTSANKAGNDFMTSLENLDTDIKSRVDFIIYEGEKQGKPSKIVDLSGKVKIIER